MRLLAESEARIMLTLEKDFWRIAVQRRVPLKQSGIVLFRVHPATPENLEPPIPGLDPHRRAHVHLQADEPLARTVRREQRFALLTPVK